MQSYTYELSEFVSLITQIDATKLQDSVFINPDIVTLFVGCDISENVSFIFHDNLTNLEIEELDEIVMAHTGKSADLTPLQIAIKNGKQFIDEYAGDARSRYLTTTAGQDIVYVAKYEECLAFIAANYPEDLTIYPFMQAESIALGVTPTQAANSIATTGIMWRYLAATIEKVRLGYKKQISLQTDINIVNSLVSKSRAILNSL